MPHDAADPDPTDDREVEEDPPEATDLTLPAESEEERVENENLGA